MSPEHPDPVIHDIDGHLVVQWPEGLTETLVARQLVEGWAERQLMTTAREPHARRARTSRALTGDRAHLRRCVRHHRSRRTHPHRLARQDREPLVTDQPTPRHPDRPGRSDRVTAISFAARIHQGLGTPIRRVTADADVILEWLRTGVAPEDPALTEATERLRQALTESGPTTVSTVWLGRRRRPDPDGYMTSAELLQEFGGKEPHE